MRKHFKGFVMGVLFMLILSATVAVVAATEGVWRQIFHGVNVTLNGASMEFDDEDRPFILDGRTFLPVRAISEALDFEVFWVAETSTVYIDATEPEVVYEPQPQSQPLFSAVPSFEGHRLQTTSVNMLGNAFPNTLRHGCGEMAQGVRRYAHGSNGLYYSRY
jgi:hypothetical protein